MLRIVKHEPSSRMDPELVLWWIFVCTDWTKSSLVAYNFFYFILLLSIILYIYAEFTKQKLNPFINTYTDAKINLSYMDVWFIDV